MGITRTVTTQVHCDVCGEWITGWESENTGVSREWAKYYARLHSWTKGYMQRVPNKAAYKKMQFAEKMRRSRNGRRRLSGIFIRMGRRAYRTLQALHSLYRV